MNNIYLILVLINLTIFARAQQSEECKLEFGTNLSGLSDYATALPFVNVMKSSREWFTKSIDDPTYPWNSDQQDFLTYRADGYPTHIPQMVEGVPYLQQVATIWAITSGWPIGEYTVLWDGDGELNLYGSIENLEIINDNKMVFDMTYPENGAVELIILNSNIENPVHNIRVLMPGTESSYQTNPFNQAWLDLLEPFKTVRFMDWGSTNNWGQDNSWEIGDSLLTDWDERSQLDHYTWAYNKGVPYEMMVELMNITDKNGWICIPHTASEDYNRKMASFFLNNLETERHLFIEYSNEIWNWIFGQTHWVDMYGCQIPGEPWPEGTVRFIQNMLNYWTDEYKDHLDQLTRVVGVFTAWQDVAERVAYNVDPETFDAISPTYYFSFTEEDGEELTALGANATVEDIASRVKDHFPQSLSWIKGIKTIADSLDKRMVFYEGGQHFTSYPFGTESTYAQALLDIQRDPIMYDLYIDWFDMINAINDTDEDFLLMNFSFIARRSAQYGSWGILETIYQDTSKINAPKYAAYLDYMKGCTMVSNEEVPYHQSISIYPNPTFGTLQLTNAYEGAYVRIFNLQQEIVKTFVYNHNCPIDISMLPKGIYILQYFHPPTRKSELKKFIKI